MAGSNPEGPLLGMPYADWDLALRAAATAEGLQDQLGAVTLHRLRHSGASLDALFKTKSLSDVQKHGRWVSSDSVRRYENGSRLPQLLAMLSPEQRHRAQRALNDPTWLL